MKYAFTHGNILTGNLDENSHMTVLTNYTLITGDDRILSVQPESSEIPSDCRIIDLNGKFLLPGLINLHAHLASSGKPPKENAKPVDYKKLFETLSKYKFVLKILTKMQANLARTQLYSGVTTLRTVGGIMDLDSRIRDKIRAGKLEGPDLFVANTAISVPGGHFAGSLATEAKSPDEAAHDVDKIAGTHPDLIKLMITGGVMDASAEGEPGVLRMKPEIINAACKRAHELGYPVAAHVESPEGVRVALENGVDTIEHGAKPTEDIIRLFREKGAVHVATLSPALPYALFDPEISHVDEMGLYNGRVVFDGIIDCAKQCLANDIPVGLGTDTGCPYVTHYDMWREIQYFHKCCGVSKTFALYTATKRNAELLGLGDVTGSIEPGKSADFIVTEKNPLVDLTVLRKLSMVAARGNIIVNPKIKKMAEVERELDKFVNTQPSPREEV